MNRKSRKRSERKEFTIVSIPTPLFKKVKERIKGTGFTSVSSYVKYVLREKVAEEEPEGPFTKKDEERLKDRLRALGYIE